MLAAPIILYDYPQIAPESPGDLFDSTEIDEILTLRILTLDGRRKASDGGRRRPRRALLERTESLAKEQLMGLHGTIRGLEAALRKPVMTPMNNENPFEERPPIERIHVAGIEFRLGGRVRICPAETMDILDMALRGKTATIASIEQDFEDRIHLALDRR